MSFKICFVGCGNMASAVHGPSCKKYASLHPEVELAACCDLDENKAVLFKNNFGFSRHYTDIDIMLDNERPQAVCLVSPIQLTCGLSCKIMGKGYPLIMEKPPGMNSKETREMIRLAENGHIPNQVAFNRRYMPLILELKSLLDMQTGPDRTMNIQFRMLRVGRKEPDFSMTAIHGIDVIRFLTGEDYKKIHFIYQELGHIGNGVANIHMDCEFASGTVGRLDFLPVSGVSVERIEISMEDNIFYINLPDSYDMTGKLVWIQKNEIKTELSGIDLCGNDEDYILRGFYNENASFFDDLQNRVKPAADIGSALQSVEVAECLRDRVEVYNKTK